jgi:tetraacyldisaccharide 4'-kinase
MRLREVQDGGGGAAGALARAGLFVLSGGYAAAVGARSLAYAVGLVTPASLPRPVVSVGNLVAGGTGKTPFVAWLAGALRAAGASPGVLSRGYGPRPEGSPLSDEGTVLADLLGPGVPQVEDPDRRRGGRALLERHPGTDVVLLDDGFQHRRVARDLDVVLVDATDPFGGGRLLPRGRLREPVRALRRAHVVVLTRTERVPPEDVVRSRAEARRVAPEVEVLLARTRPVSLVAPDGSRLPLEVLRGARVALQAGIGNPAAFEGAVADAGGEVVARRFLRDHHRPGPDEGEALRRLAANADLVVVTRKDLVKLRTLPDLPDSLRALDVVTDVEDGATLVSRVLSLRSGS